MPIAATVTKVTTVNNAAVGATCFRETCCDQRERTTGLFIIKTQYTYIGSNCINIKI